MAARARMNHMLAPSSEFVNYVDLIGPLAHWRMNDSGSALVDRIAAEQAVLNGSGYTLGTVGLLAADNDHAVGWTAAGYASTSAKNKWVLGAGDYSAFVLMTTTLPTRGAMLAIRDSGNSNMILVIFIGDVTSGVINTSCWNNWSSNPAKPIDTKTVNDGKVHAVGATYEAATGTSRLYVDGFLVSTKTSALAKPSAATTVNVMIGANVGVQQWQGVLDEVVLFDKLLTTTQMNTLASYRRNT